MPLSPWISTSFSSSPVSLFSILYLIALIPEFSTGTSVGVSTSVVVPSSFSTVSFTITVTVDSMSFAVNSTVTSCSGAVGETTLSSGAVLSIRTVVFTLSECKPA